MKRALFALVLAVLAAAPLAARADGGTDSVGLRLGLEVPILDHQSSGTVYIGSPFAPSVNVMLSYFLLHDFLALDAELSEGLAFNAPGGGVQRTGTELRLGVTLRPPVLPIYVNALIPIHLEPSPVSYYGRLAPGLEAQFSIGRLFVELPLDFSLGGGTAGAFAEQIISVAGGWQVRF